EPPGDSPETLRAVLAPHPATGWCYVVWPLGSPGFRGVRVGLPSRTSTCQGGGEEVRSGHRAAPEVGQVVIRGRTVAAGIQSELTLGELSGAADGSEVRSFLGIEVREEVLNRETTHIGFPSLDFSRSAGLGGFALDDLGLLGAGFPLLQLTPGLGFD